MTNNNEEKQPLPVSHFSPISGFANQNTDLTLLYYGFTFRIKANEIGKPKQKILDQRSFDRIRKLIANPPPDCEYVSDGAIERCDIYDWPSGDIIAMVRIPFRVTG